MGGNFGWDTAKLKHLSQKFYQFQLLQSDFNLSWTFTTILLSYFYTYLHTVLRLSSLHHGNAANIKTPGLQ
jgi:hypothetical protein